MASATFQSVESPMPGAPRAAWLIPVLLVAMALDMTTGKMLLTFSEPILSSRVNVGLMTLQGVNVTTDAEHWAHFSPQLHSFLAGLPSTPAVAERWAKKLEWEHPPTAIVTQLVEVAGEAVAAKKQMYTYVSL